jgi:PAS domain S-box-containing protein
MSPSASQVLGRGPDECIGEVAFEYVHPDDKERVMELFSEAVSNPEMNPTTEFRFRHGDGSWIWIEAIGNNQLDNPAIEGFVVNNRDITERKEQAQRVQRERDRLDKLAGTVSHDLRNPLNVATGRLALAQEDCESEHLAIVERSHDRMEELIENVLSLAQAAEGTGGIEVIDVAALVETCWQNVETDAAELVVATDASIRADETQLKQLLENLLRNAIEHGGDNVSITIGDLLGGIYVADDGPGIPENERSDVFEYGYSNSDSGTGFGLSIVRDIADTHGWDITVAESEQGGARFELTGIESVD